jgi:hypothetical protein
MFRVRRVAGENHDAAFRRVSDGTQNATGSELVGFHKVFVVVLVKACLLSSSVFTGAEGEGLFVAVAVVVGMAEDRWTNSTALACMSVRDSWE